MNDNHSGRAFLRITSNSRRWICPVGQPIQGQASDTALFLPQWMIESARFRGVGEECTVTVFTEEAFPEATKLVLRVIDSAFYNSDVKEELELALSSLGVVMNHSLLEIPIQALGGFHIEVFVANTEPADVVLCHGEEVILEFEEPVDQLHVPRPPTPIPQFPPLFIAPGNGSEVVLHDMPSGEPTGFVPFQGEGRLLGGTNPSLPEWRKTCPPKRQP